MGRLSGALEQILTNADSFIDKQLDKQGIPVEKHQPEVPPIPVEIALIVRDVEALAELTELLETTVHGIEIHRIVYQSKNQRGELQWKELE